MSASTRETVQGHSPKVSLWIATPPKRASRYILRAMWHRGLSRCRRRTLTKCSTSDSKPYRQLWQSHRRTDCHQGNRGRQPLEGKHRNRARRRQYAALYADFSQAVYTQARRKRRYKMHGRSYISCLRFFKEKNCK